VTTWNLAKWKGSATYCLSVCLLRATVRYHGAHRDDFSRCL
jgi:uncharacterized protein YbbK (DUF523 family)